MADCTNSNCKKSYIGKTGRRLSVRAKEHLGDKSYLGEHTIRTGHRPVTLKDFRILSSGFRLPKGREIAEVLFIRSDKPDINVHEASIPLKLF